MLAVPFLFEGSCIYGLASEPLVKHGPTPSERTNVDRAARRNIHVGH